MVTFQLRRMKTEDISELLEFYMLANPHSNSESIEKWTLDTIRENPDLCYVAEVQGRVIGGVSALMRDKEIGIIDDLAVAPKYQRKGIGSKLLKKAMEELRHKGAEIIALKIHYLCSDSIPFYYKHGFRISGMVQDCFGQKQDAITMNKYL